jgi:hypothetical protein
MRGRGAVSCDGTSAVATAAEAPPVIAKDIPAAPNTGKVVLRPFRFEACFRRAMAEPSDICEQISANDKFET